MKRPNYLFLYLDLFLLMTVGAFFWQMFFPQVADWYSVWPSSRGWQEEIALWNVGIDLGIVITLLKRNVEFAKILAVISTALSILLGGHHLIYAIVSGGSTLLHWLGAAEVFLLGGGTGIFAIIQSGMFKKSRRSGS